MAKISPGKQGTGVGFIEVVKKDAVEVISSSGLAGREEVVEGEEQPE